MGTVRVILLIIHIISAGAWISEEVVGRIMKRLMDTQKGKPAELTLAKATLTLLSSIGPIASMGILITGIGMTLNNGWVLFGIGGFTPTWLFIKQIIYVALIVIVMGFVRPNAERLQKAFDVSTAGGVLTDEARGLLPQTWLLGDIHTLLVLINIILAVWKPG